MQLLLLLPLYLIHVLWLSQHRLALPGWLAGVAELENLAGCAALAAFAASRRRLRVAERMRRFADASRAAHSRHTVTALLETTATLLLAYLVAGRVGIGSERLLQWLSERGVPLSAGTSRALHVLAGHLSWVLMAVRVLGARLPPFFARGGWIELRWRGAAWAAWALGGYALSVAGYNAVEVLNSAVLPAEAYLEETVAGQLVRPDDGGLVARALGGVGPCVTAPVFEEVLYRGFLLPVLLRLGLPLRAAIGANALLFALHHDSLQALLPLTFLGGLWACLYAATEGNLLVTVLVHAMWNWRIFLVRGLG